MKSHTLFVDLRKCHRMFLASDDKEVVMLRRTKALAECVFLDDFIMSTVYAVRMANRRACLMLTVCRSSGR